MLLEDYKCDINAKKSKICFYHRISGIFIQKLKLVYLNGQILYCTKSKNDVCTKQVVSANEVSMKVDMVLFSSR